MPGLSAKVFRTYNASVTLEKELEDLPVDTKEAEKVRAHAARSTQRSRSRGTLSSRR
jgi:hypothetical protein